MEKIVLIACWANAMAEFLELDWKAQMLGRDIIRDWKSTEPKDKAISVQSLRNLIQRSDDRELKDNMQQDDKTLLKFLYARKFDINDTYELIRNYYWYRRKNPEIFRNFTIQAEDIRKSLENGLPGVLESRDRKGRCILIVNGINWDCSYSLMSIYRALLYTLEFLIQNIHNQANGFVVLVDWTEFSFRQSTNLKPSVLKTMIEGLQDCFPARFKGIHFIGQPWYVEAALTVIKPFLKDKTKERIYVHGNNLSTLHNYVHVDVLPAEMGGEQASYNPEIWLKQIMQSDKA
ncbi:alpha-tocopherol transfer protein-related [Holotrichia oblita]|uniref:Alpha-tocopherol transfer protein-related n=1 Tax=Holotrichia oblita TaxID=644536 RepID=A0ACB9SPE9_HOLOL|nr:alpha-tocopherol transfer protein-related [Holotrichia oblita]